MKIKAVINPVSGQHDMRHMTQEVVARLAACKLLDSQHILYTLPGQKELVNEAFLEDCDILMTVGGDGTLHHVINDIKKYGADTPIAYFPTGTMNDFAAGLQLPVTAEDFCGMLTEPAVRRIDLGKAGKSYFHYVACGGAVVSISYETNQHLKNMIGKAAYYLSAVAQLPKILEGKKIRVESKEYTDDLEAILFLISNSPIVGGFQNMIPDAKFDDGKLHVLIIKKGTVIDAVQQFYDVVNGSHINRPDIVRFQTEQVRITQEDGGMLDIDGELGESSPFDIEIIPDGLSVIVPNR